MDARVRDGQPDRLHETRRRAGKSLSLSLFPPSLSGHGHLVELEECRIRRESPPSVPLALPRLNLLLPSSMSPSIDPEPDPDPPRRRRPLLSGRNRRSCSRATRLRSSRPDLARLARRRRRLSRPCLEPRSPHALPHSSRGEVNFQPNLVASRPSSRNESSTTTRRATPPRPRSTLTRTTMTTKQSAI